MNRLTKSCLISMWILLLAVVVAFNPFCSYAAKASSKAETEILEETWSKPNAVFEVDKMGDMSGWDPAKWVNPSGDTIKIAVFWPHSG